MSTDPFALLRATAAAQHLDDEHDQEHARD